MNPWPVEADTAEVDPLVLLESLRASAERITLFCDAGRIYVPPADRPLLAHLEGSVIECVAPHGGAFHPKIWLLRISSWSAVSTESTVATPPVVVSVTISPGTTPAKASVGSSRSCVSCTEESNSATEVRIATLAIPPAAPHNPPNPIRKLNTIADGRAPNALVMVQHRVITQPGA